jgi:hypothetical protein
MPLLALSYHQEVWMALERCPFRSEHPMKSEKIWRSSGQIEQHFQGKEGGWSFLLGQRFNKLSPNPEMYDYNNYPNPPPYPPTNIIPGTVTTNNSASVNYPGTPHGSWNPADPQPPTFISGTAQPVEVVTGSNVIMLHDDSTSFFSSIVHWFSDAPQVPNKCWNPEITVFMKVMYSLTFGPAIVCIFIAIMLLVFVGADNTNSFGVLWISIVLISVGAVFLGVGLCMLACQCGWDGDICCCC